MSKGEQRIKDGDQSRSKIHKAFENTNGYLTI